MTSGIKPTTIRFKYGYSKLPVANTYGLKAIMLFTIIQVQKDPL